MEIEIKVISNASKNTIKKEENLLKVYVTAQREKGKANRMVIKLLADYFKISKSAVKIIRGEKSNKKTVLVSAS
jgi:uncharacterized protein (TIGR00251 family)